MNDKARVTLIGAGPGDPELITVKAVNALAEADIVLFDSLINIELLNYAVKAIKINVGKRKGYQPYSQDTINELIVENAFKYGHVVRLKGGDPFIFGRGSEELDYVNNFEIPFTIIPGISSSLAVPANVGIPLTKRGIAASFWVITGCTSKKEISEDIKIAAQSTATLVILMGMHKLKEIISVLLENDLGNKPVAIIQNGTTTNEKTGVGTVNNIMAIVTLKKLASPAIIVIGDVVKERHRLKEFCENISYKHLLPA
jgi:uroporphyrin-III C-methyltransferase